MRSEERLLSRLSVPVLRAVAKRLEIEDAETLDREALVAAILAVPSHRAAAAGQSVRRLVSRLPGTLLRGVRSWVPPAPDASPGSGDGPAKPARKSSPRKSSPGARSRKDPLPPAAPDGGVDFETISMVDLLLKQGHVERARETLERILARQPDNEEARRRLERLRGGTAPAGPVPREVDPPPASAEQPQGAHRQRVEEPVFRPFAERGGEPIGLLDFEEPPLGYRRVYAGLLPVDTGTQYAYWEVTHEAVEAIRKRLGDDGARLTIRLISHHSDAPAGGDIRDVEVTDYVGEYFFLDLRSGAKHRLAVGLRAASGVFEPACHTGTSATPVAAPPGDTRELWLEVEPPTNGRAPAPQAIRIVQRVEGSPEAALEARIRRIGLAGLPEDARTRLLSRFRELLRTLWSRDGGLPMSPTAPPGARL